jgi:uncharacterized membrane protein
LGTGNQVPASILAERRNFWSRQHWGTPFAYLLLAIAVGIILPRIDQNLDIPPGFTVSVNSEVAILSSIASGMMALTAIVFSLLLVMVQVGGAAFSPRLVQWLAHDGPLRHALGVFIGTFVFALMALSAVDRGGSGRVPLFTTLVAFAWLLASIVLLVLLVERVSRLYITNVLAAIGARGRTVIANLYGAVSDPVEPPAPDTKATDVEALPITQHIYFHGGPLTVVYIDIRRLLKLAQQVDGLIEVNYAVGDVVTDGAPIANLRSAQCVLTQKALYRCIELGPERTMHQDPKYVIRLLVDIAIRALSPAVNDPTTAVQALHQLEDLLRRLGRAHLEVSRVYDAQNRLRVVYPTPTWEDFLDLALLEIIYYGAGSIQVMRRLGALLDDLEDAVLPSRRAEVQRHKALLHKIVDQSFVNREMRAEAQDVDRQGLGLTRHE